MQASPFFQNHYTSQRTPYKFCLAVKQLKVVADEAHPWEPLIILGGKTSPQMFFPNGKVVF